MSDSNCSSFLEANTPHNPNNFNHLDNYETETDIIDHENFDPFDIMVAEELETDFTSILAELQQEITTNNTILSTPDVPRRHDSGGKGVKIDERKRIAFRTKSGIDIMDDGYRWRKYGKKAVKNSRNPRNYFKCLKAGCNVKKTVQRDTEDPDYVTTTYEGMHNHEALH